MRRFFKWFGIGVGALFVALLFLVGIPQTLFSQMFPIKTYDHVEAVLEIDGERVTVLGTALCTRVKGYLPSSSPASGSTTDTGGTAVTVMSDGRAVVIPYTGREYCRGALSADGYYDDWWEVFDQRFSLRGNIDILILDDGNDPTSAEVILGPEYFQNPNASIKLISADRWRSERGEETTSSLDWFSSTTTTKYSRAWGAAYVAVLEAEFYRADPKFLPLIEYLRVHGNDDDPPAAPNGRWREAAFEQPGVITRPVSVTGTDVTLMQPGEPFRIPMKPVSAFPTRRDLGTRPLVDLAACYGPSTPDGWSTIGEVTFSSNGRHLSISPVGLPKDQPRSFFFDRETQDLFFGDAICVRPH